MYIYICISPIQTRDRERKKEKERERAREREREREELQLHCGARVINRHGHSSSTPHPWVGTSHGGRLPGKVPRYPAHRTSTPHPWVGASHGGRLPGKVLGGAKPRLGGTGGPGARALVAPSGSFGPATRASWLATTLQKRCAGDSPPRILAFNMQLQPLRAAPAPGPSHKR